MYRLSFHFIDPRMLFILSSCGHPCVRVWVGGFTFLSCHGQISSQPKHYPTLNLSMGGLMEQSSWKAFPNPFSIDSVRFEMLQEWTINLANVPALLLGHQGQKPNFRPQTIAKQRLKKRRHSISSDSVSLCSHVHLRCQC